jgi:hypothetical protein
MEYVTNPHFSPFVEEHQRWYADQCQKYWRFKGFSKAKFWIERQAQKSKDQFGKPYTSVVWAIKSNLVNGIPPRD